MARTILLATVLLAASLPAEDRMKPTPLALATCLLAAHVTVAAADVDQVQDVKLRDGRTLVGTYDSAAGIVYVQAGTMKATVRVAAADVVSVQDHVGPVGATDPEPVPPKERKGTSALAAPGGVRIVQVPGYDAAVAAKVEAIVSAMPVPGDYTRAMNGGTPVRENGCFISYQTTGGGPMGKRVNLDETPSGQSLKKYLSGRLSSEVVATLVDAQPGLVERLDAARLLATEGMPTAPALTDAAEVEKALNSSPRIFLPRGLSGWQAIKITLRQLHGGMPFNPPLNLVVYGRYLPAQRTIIAHDYCHSDYVGDRATQWDELPDVDPQDVHEVTELSPRDVLVRCPGVLIVDPEYQDAYDLVIPLPKDMGVPAGATHMTTRRGLLCWPLGGIIDRSKVQPLKKEWIAKITPAAQVKIEAEAWAKKNAELAAKLAAQRPNAQELKQLLEQQDKDLALIVDAIAKATTAYAPAKTLADEFTTQMKQAIELNGRIKEATAANNNLEKDGGTMQVKGLDGTVTTVQLNRRNWEVRDQIQGMQRDLAVFRGKLLSLRAKYTEATRQIGRYKAEIQAAIKRVRAAQERIKLAAPDQVKPIPWPDPELCGITIYDAAIEAAKMDKLREINQKKIDQLNAEYQKSQAAQPAATEAKPKGTTAKSVEDLRREMQLLGEE